MWNDGGRRSSRKEFRYDIEVLKENPHGHNKIGKTNLMILDDIEI